MNARIARKLASRFSASVVSVPTALSHAKASFWTLDRGMQRQALAQVMRRKLGVGKDAATWAARQWANNADGMYWLAATNDTLLSELRPSVGERVDGGASE